MRQHLASERVQCERQFRLGVCGTVTVEPGAEIGKAKRAEDIVAAARGEAGDVALSPILNAFFVRAICPWSATAPMSSRLRDRRGS